MPLPAVGLFLNAYPISCSGPHRFTRLSLPVEDWTEARRELERELGESVQIYGGYAWVIGEREGGDVIDVACEEHPHLHQFLLRDGFQRQARSRGFDTWLGFGGE